nr:glycosyltransferase [Zhihengliuella flava]
MTGRRTGYVVKVYPRFSETFIVTEILAREDAGEELTIFALRPTTDTRFHPEIARVQAPVHFVPRSVKLSEAWSQIAEATAEIDGFAARYGRLLPELAGLDPSEAQQAVALAIGARRAGLTHLHAHFGSMAGRVAWMAAELAGLEFSVTTHAKDLFHESVDRERLGRMLERAHHMVTISEFNLEYLRAAYPRLAHKVHLLYNGLELARFPYRDPAPTVGRLRVAAVGRLVEKKGFAHLIRVAALLRAQGCDLEVRIAGDGELAHDLQARIEQTGAPVALLGARTQAEVRELLDWADVFAAPCVVGADGNADGLPTVLLEAMAMGVPCVATAVTGIPEAIIDGHTGVLLEPGDDDGLAAALRSFAAPAAAERSVRLARSARALIEERFNAARQGRALAALESHPEDDLAGRRVAYVCVDPGIPVFGSKGASVHVQEIIRALRARGADVRLYCTRRGDTRDGGAPADLAEIDVTEVPVERAEAAGGRELAQRAAAATLATAIRQDGADVVLERYSLFSTVLEDLAADGVPGILEVNAPLIDEQRTHRELIHESLARQTLIRQVRAARRTVCVSEPVAAWVNASVEAAGDVRVVSNGVNTDRIRPAADRGSRAQVGADVEAVFVGTLKPWHGVESLIDAVARSAGQWRLRIVGDGPQAPALRERAAAHGPATAARITFVGAVPPSDMCEQLAAADLAVAPYPEAGSAESYFSPLKIYEYLAAGLPVVGSRVGQVPNIVDDGVTGTLVPPSDADALAEALDALAADPVRRAAMGRAGRARAVAEHDWSRVLDSVLSGVDLPRRELSGMGERR